MVGAWGATPSTWNFGSTDPRWNEIADFQQIIARSSSAVTPSEKSNFASVALGLSFGWTDGLLLESGSVMVDYYKPFISKALRYGLCVTMGSHSFTCHTRTIPSFSRKASPPLDWYALRLTHEGMARLSWPASLVTYRECPAPGI